MAFDETSRALERFTDTTRFELLVGQLLLPDFPDLRLTGGPGDRGRDAVAGTYFIGDGDEKIITISLERRWAQKVRRDFQKIKENRLAPKLVVAITNRKASAKTEAALEAEAAENGWAFKLYSQRTLALRLEQPSHLKLRREYLGLPDPEPTFFLRSDELPRGSLAVDTVFCGREDELKHLAERLKEANALLLEGAGGVGKTRLVRALEGGSAGTEWHWAAEGMPFETRYLAQLGSGSAALVVIDNAHRRDDLPKLLAALARREPQPKLLLITRSGYREMVDDAYQDIFDSGLSFWRLGPLARSEINALLEAEPFSIAEEGIRRRIVDLAEGNPALAVAAGELTVEGVDAVSLSGSEVFEKYAERLALTATRGDRARQEVAAVVAALRSLSLADPATVHVAEEVTGLGAVDLRRALDDLADAGLFDEQSGVYQVKPDLVSDALVRAKFFRRRPLLRYPELYRFLAPHQRLQLLEAFTAARPSDKAPGYQEAVAAIRADVTNSDHSIRDRAEFSLALAPALPELSCDLISAVLRELEAADIAAQESVVGLLLEALNRASELTISWPLTLEVGVVAYANGLNEAIEKYEKAMTGIWNRMPLGLGLPDGQVVAWMQNFLSSETRSFWNSHQHDPATAQALAVAAWPLLMTNFESHAESAADEMTINLRSLQFGASPGTRSALEAGAELWLATFPDLDDAPQYRQIKQALESLTNAALGNMIPFGGSPSAEVTELAGEVLSGIEDSLRHDIDRLARPVAAEIVHQVDLRRERGSEIPPVTVGPELREYLDLIDPEDHHFDFGEEREVREKGTAAYHAERWAALDDAELEKTMQRLAADHDAAERLTKTTPWSSTLPLALADFAERDSRAFALFESLLAGDSALLARSVPLVEELIGQADDPDALLQRWLEEAGAAGRRTLAAAGPFLPGARRQRRVLEALRGDNDQSVRLAAWWALWRMRPTKSWIATSLLDLGPTSGLREQEYALHRIHDAIEQGEIKGLTRRQHALARQLVLATAEATDRHASRHFDEILQLSLDLELGCVMDWVWARIEFSVAADKPFGSDPLPDEIEPVIQNLPDQERSAHLPRAIELYESGDLKWPLSEAVENLLAWLDTPHDVLTAKIGEWMHDGEEGLRRAAGVLQRTRDPELYATRARAMLAVRADAAARQAVASPIFGRFAFGSEAAIWNTQAERLERFIDDRDPSLRAVAREASAAYRRKASESNDADR